MDMAFSPERSKGWLPVDMYIGGAEHSVLHLLYSRFVTMALHDMGHVGFDEPFTVFRAHGLLIKEGAKMSKSKGNVINPDEYIARYGADTLRTYLMFLAPFSQGGDFRDESVMGIYRFLNRVWALGSRELGARTDSTIQKILHKTIKKVTEDIAGLKYNTAISAMMILLRELEAGTSSKDDVRIFLQLLAPFAPHITEELWQKLGGEGLPRPQAGSIHTSAWPVWDAKLVIEDIFDLVIQINGKTKKVIQAPRGITQAEAVKLAAIDGIPKRIIFVPDRLINYIV
jgi:leucyl-tRNA synthetase